MNSESDKDNEEDENVSKDNEVKMKESIEANIPCGLLEEGSMRTEIIGKQKFILCGTGVSDDKESEKEDEDEDDEEQISLDKDDNEDEGNINGDTDGSDTSNHIDEKIKIMVAEMALRKEKRPMRPEIKTNKTSVNMSR